MRHAPQPVRGRLRRAVGAGVVTVLLTGGLAACGQSGPADTLDAFLAGWRGGNLDKVGFVTPDGGRIAANAVVDQLQTLTGDLTRTPLVLKREGKPGARTEVQLRIGFSRCLIADSHAGAPLTHHTVGSIVCISSLERSRSSPAGRGPQSQRPFGGRGGAVRGAAFTVLRSYPSVQRLPPR